MHKVYFETSCQSVRELFSKKTTSGSTRFPNQFTIIRFKSDTGRNTLQYRGPVIWNFLNRLVKVPENFNSYKQILKKHTRDIAEYSFSQEATLITAKKRWFYILLSILFSGIILLFQLGSCKSQFFACIYIVFSLCIAFILLLTSFVFVKFWLCIVGPHQPFGCQTISTYLSKKVYLTLPLPICNHELPKPRSEIYPEAERL